ncbi:hypothetical protein [Planktothrix sp. PCC 11201]|nr:hypothetical protein [Planktothrix sp. PCC 11201]
MKIEKSIDRYNSKSCPTRNSGFSDAKNSEISLVLIVPNKCE